MARAAAAAFEAALVASQISARIGNVTIQRLTGFPAVSGDTQLARAVALLDPAIRRARDDAGADIVSILMSSTTELGECGVAFVQRPGCTYPTATQGCGMQGAFADYALNLVAQECAIGQDSFAHEIGHNLGAEHHRTDSGVPPDRASFPHSYAHIAPFNFQTVMSALGGSLARELVFSNPNVSIRGDATGIAGERNNALTLETLYPHARAFRDGPIFKDGLDEEVSCPTVAM